MTAMQSRVLAALAELGGAENCFGLAEYLGDSLVSVRRILRSLDAHGLIEVDEVTSRMPCGGSGQRFLYATLLPAGEAALHAAAKGRGSGADEAETAGE